MDPFEGKYDGNYSADVRKAVSDIDVAQTQKMKVNLENITKFRNILFRYQLSSGLKFKTKTDEDGNLWVKRIS